MPGLSGQKIQERLSSPDLDTRLVVRPLLSPEEQLRDDQASIDIRLGFEFALVAPSSYGAIDEFDGATESGSLQKLYSKRYVPFGKRIVIHPHQFILAATLEYIRLPQDLLAYVIGRSTWGRLGLIVATAVGIQPGFAGTLTLELRNLGETPLTLYPGQSIAQLFIHSVDKGEGVGEGLGQYSGATGILPRKVSSSHTHDKLRKLVEKNR